MGCACSKTEEKAKPKGISKDQQAKMNEASKALVQGVQDDVNAALADAKALDAASDAKDGTEEEDEAAKEEKRAEVARKMKKVRKRATKLETLENARNVEALSLEDYNAAIRRLQSVTGEDPTNPDAKVSLPEGLGWLNTILEVLWPSFKKHLGKVVEGGLDDFCRQFAQWYGASCQVEDFIFDRSDAPCGFGPISARRVVGMDGVEDGALEVSLGISYQSTMVCALATSMGRVVVQNMDFLGTMFLYFRPFIDEMPLLGGVQIAFANQPTINLDWSGFLGDMATMGSMRQKVTNYIDWLVGSYCVMPYFFPIALHSKFQDSAKLKCPQPEGLVRLTVVDATNFPSTTFGGGFDVYLDVSVGMTKWQSNTVKNSRNPAWNETHDFLVYNQEQWINIKMYDKQSMLSDSLIGELMHLPVNRLVKRKIAEVPLTKDGLPLFGADEGGDEPPPCVLRLRAEWIAIKDDSPAASTRMVSTYVKEITDVPAQSVMKKLELPGPYKVEAVVGEEKAETWAGTAKPGASMDSHEALRIIREMYEAGQENEAIITATGLQDDTAADFIKAATKKSDGKYYLQNDTDDLAWWKSHECFTNWRLRPRGKINDNNLAERPVFWARADKDAPKPYASDTELDRREKWFQRYSEVDHWHYNVAYDISCTHAANNPNYEHILHLNTSTVDTVTINVYSYAKNALVGSLTMKVEDTNQGDEPDLVGPFDIPIKGDEQGRKIKVHGNVTVKGLEVGAELPANWNLKMDSIDQNEFVEWWKDEVYATEYIEKKGEGEKWLAVDWPGGDRTRIDADEEAKRVRFYEGSTEDTKGGSSEGKTLRIQEAALRRCLRAGALTWGDYDCIVARLRGEKDAPQVAESLEWVNMLIDCMWPSAKAFAASLVKESVEPQLKEAVQQASGGFASIASLDVNITKFDLGSKPPFFNTIQVTPERGPNAWGGKWQAFSLMLHNISLVSDIDISLAVAVETAMGKTEIPLGVKDLLFRTTVQVDCGPLLPEPPFMGYIRVNLPNAPEIDFDLTGVTDLVEKIPGVKNIAIGVILDNIGAVCVAPNFIVQPLADGLNSCDVTYPRPIGILQVDVRSAQNLMAGDVNPVTGEKNSDSYVVLRVGRSTFSTQPVTSLNPRWEFSNTAFFPIHSWEQKVQIDVYDSDGAIAGGDDHLGGVHCLETVLGGGIDLVYPGIPVRSLLRHGTVVTLPLTTKVRDDVSSKANHIVHEMKPVIGESKIASSITVCPQMLNLDNDGSFIVAYLIDLRVDELTGLPATAVADLCGPYTVNLAINNHSAVTKTGQGKAKFVDGRSFAKKVREMARGNISVNDIAKLAHVSIELVEQVLAKAKESPEMLDDEEGDFLKQWTDDVNAMKQLNASVTRPRFDQRLYVILPVDKDDERGQCGRSSLPMTLTVQDKFNRTLATRTFDYNVQEHIDPATNKLASITGPWNIDVDIAEGSGGTGGVLASVMGNTAPPLPKYKGTWELHGLLSVDGLRQRIMDAD